MGISNILKEEVERIKLSDEELSNLSEITKEVVSSLDKKIKRLGIKASVFVGGSLAKNTIIRKKKYDIDLFIRFDSKYTEEDIKKQMKRIFFWFRIPKHKFKLKKIHGSRDYYQLIPRFNKNLSFEIIPNLKINKPSEARNITDLSYFHVNYIKKKVQKNKKLLEEIMLAKSFCHGQKCYGAESYIKGFSGYALELLIVYFKNFENFIETISKTDGKIIMDVEKLYKSNEEIIKELNPSKKESPIILIDPTFKERNAAGALSVETYNKFKDSCKKFLKSPSLEFFENKGVDIVHFDNTAKELNGIFAVFEIKTKKQEGDIAGSKMLKFSRVFSNELKNYFDILEEEFDYWGEKKANIYYVLKRKSEIVFEGPSIHYHEAAEKFKKAHPIWYVKDGKIKAAKPVDLSVNEFLKYFNKKFKKTMREMSIKKVKLV